MRVVHRGEWVQEHLVSAERAPLGRPCISGVDRGVRCEQVTALGAPPQPNAADKPQQADRESRERHESQSRDENTDHDVENHHVTRFPGLIAEAECYRR